MMKDLWIFEGVKEPWNENKRDPKNPINTHVIAVRLWFDVDSEVKALDSQDLGQCITHICIAMMNLNVFLEFDEHTTPLSFAGKWNLQTRFRHATNSPMMN